MGMPVQPSVSTRNWGRERGSFSAQRQHKNVKTLFTPLPNYGVDSSMFQAKNGRDSTFN